MGAVCPGRCAIGSPTAEAIPSFARSMEVGATIPLTLGGGGEEALGVFGVPS